MEIDGHVVKGEAVHMSQTQDLMEWSPQEELSFNVMLSSTKFTPVKLFSDDLATLNLPDDCKYKPKSRTNRQIVW